MNQDYLSAPGTFSKSPSMFGFEPDLHVTQADGQRLGLSDGKWYIDWPNGLGGNLIGYNDPLFTQALVDQLYRVGGSVSLPTRLEYEVAELLCTMLGKHIIGWQPSLLSARFAKTGSDATTMAVRLARAVTGRDWAVCFRGHYHGWGDWTVSRTDPAHGIPRSDYVGKRHSILEINWGDSLVDVIDSDIAAVIFEVGITDPDPIYLSQLRRYCDDYGILLIVDEVVTGLRYGLGGACERYGIQPDLVCMGKALGNGRPVSALVGPREYLDWFKRDDPVFCSSTHWGDPVDLAAAKHVLENWSQNDVRWLWEMGGLLMEGLRESGWNVVGHPCRSLIQFDDEYTRAFFIQSMRQAGILWNRPTFTTRATTAKMVEHTVNAAKLIREGIDTFTPQSIKEMMEPHLPRVLFRSR